MTVPDRGFGRRGYHHGQPENPEPNGALPRGRQRQRGQPCGAARPCSGLAEPSGSDEVPPASSLLIASLQQSASAMGVVQRQQRRSRVPLAHGTQQRRRHLRGKQLRPGLQPAAGTATRRSRHGRSRRRRDPRFDLLLERRLGSESATRACSARSWRPRRREPATRSSRPALRVSFPRLCQRNLRHHLAARLCAF
jgi:hypothetical protein